MSPGAPDTTPGKCPHCSSTRVVKNGRSRGRQRLLCGTCSKTFGTAPAARPPIRLTAQYRRFISLCTTRHTLRFLAAATGVALSTAHRWRLIYMRSLPPGGKTSTNLDSPAITESLISGTPWLATESKRRTPQMCRFSYWMPPGVTVARVFHIGNCTAAGARPPFSMVDTSMSAAFGQLAAKWGLSRACVMQCLQRLMHHYGDWRFRTALKLMGEKYRAWMRRFRGIAVKYVEYYTAWYNACVA